MSKGLKLLFPLALVSSLALPIYAASNSVSCQNTWIKALIAETQPPANVSQYAEQIYNLASDADQINLRVTLHGITTEDAYNGVIQQYVNLINDLRADYGSHSITIGFHPDNSKYSYTDWWNTKDGRDQACTKGDWQCVLNDSIILMNTINAKLPNGKGFNEFSIEQSYVEPQNQATASEAGIQNVKSCLDGNKNSTYACPAGITLAEPAVTYGYVGPSYGAPNQYGPSVYDYGYPQYYNLYHTFAIEEGQQPPYLPSSSTGKLQPGVKYMVLDANIDAKSFSNVLPLSVANNPGKITVFTLQPGQTEIDPSLPAAYDAYLFSQKQTSSKPNSTNAVVYITLSGEPEFLGAQGWSHEKLCEYHQGLINDFKQHYPNVNPNKIQFAIWNFLALLNQQ